MPIINVVGGGGGAAGGLVYQGTWDADLNLTAPGGDTLLDNGVPGEAGQYYIVSVAGTTSVDGNAEWDVGDWIAHNGTTWYKVDNSGFEEVLVSQVHTFDVGTPIYHNGTSWVKAQANDRDTLAMAVVSWVDTPLGGSAFKYRTFGNMPWPLHGFIKGDFLFVSDTVSGTLVATEPLGLTVFSNPVAYVVDDNSVAILAALRPISSLPRSNDMRHKEIAVASYDVDDLDESLLVDASGGDVEINLTQDADHEGFTISIKKMDATANTVTVQADAGQVEFGATHVITERGHAYKYSSHDGNYYIMP
jgi:hypothetical protein